MLHRIALLAVVATAAAIPATAGAVAGPIPAPHLSGAYLVWDKQDHALAMIARTNDPLARRQGTQGGILGVGLVGHSAGSLGSVKAGNPHHCYVVYISAPKATVGLGHSYRVGIRTSGGTSTRTVKLRSERTGDLLGKPLGC